MLQAGDTEAIAKGIQLPTVANNDVPKVSGRLFFQTTQMTHDLPKELPGQLADNAILGIVIGLQKTYPETTVTLVSKDINLRIKATVLGVHSEDYYNDKGTLHREEKVTIEEEGNGLSKVKSETGAIFIIPTHILKKIA